MNWLIKISSFVYIIGGIVAAYLSFKIEYAILQDILGNFDPHFALVGAGLFEAIKICTIVLYRSSSASPDLLPDSVKGATWLLRSGLFIFALFCALAFFSKFLTSPNSETLRINETQTLTADFEGRINTANNDTEISKFQSELDAERKNIRGGTFIGERYRDFDARLVAAKKARDEKIEKLTEEKANRLEAIRNKDYQNDAQARNKTINDLVATVRNVTGINLEYSGVIFFLTALISILIELSIWVTFELLVIGGLSKGSALRAEADQIDEQIRAAKEVAKKQTVLNEVLLRLNSVKLFGEGIKLWFKNKPLK